ASLLLGRNGEIDVAGVGEGKPAQDRVAVAAASPHPHVGKPGPVAQPEHLAQHFHLALAPAAAGAFVDLLQQHYVRLVVGDGIAHPLRIAATVDAADALVDVVGYEPYPHAAEFPIRLEGADLSLAASGTSARERR